MASKFVVVVNTNNDAATTASEIAPNVASNPHTSGADAWAAIDKIAAFIQAQGLGRGVNVVVNTGAVAATGLVTFTGAPSNNETLSIANVTFTAKTSGATGNQFNIGGDVATTAENLATAINASSDMAGIISASSSAGVVTLTSLVPGTIGNGLELSESLSNATVTAFASGAESNRTTLSAGL